MRLLYIHSGFPNASEPFISNEIEHLRSQGAEVHILDLRPRQGRIKLDSLSYNTYSPIKLMFSTFWNVSVPAWMYGESKKSSLIKWLYFKYSRGYLFRQIKKIAPDRIISHFLFDSTLCASKLAEAAKVPHDIRIHTAYSTLNQNSLKHVLGRASNVISSTVSAKKKYAEFAASDIDVVRQEINLPKLKFADIQPADIEMVAFGRLVPKKGFSNLIQALDLLSDDLKKNIRLTIYGEGKERQRLRNQLQQSHGTQIEICPPVGHKNYLDILSRSAVLVVPSTDVGDIDGLPTVIAEAMAVGTLVIGTRVGGISEVAKDNKNAFLAEGSDADALAAVIQRAIEQREYWPELVAAARNSVEQAFNRRLTLNDLKGS